MRSASARFVSLAAGLSLAAAALQGSGPATWAWGELEAGKSYPSVLRVSNKCEAPAVVSISHNLPMLSMPSTATVPPGVSDVKAAIAIPPGAHGEITGQITVRFPGSLTPPCEAATQIYLVAGRIANAGAAGPGGGRGAGNAPETREPSTGSSYDDALDSFHAGRDLTDDARDAQRDGDGAAAHALAGKALDELQDARDVLEEGLKNGEIGEQAGTVLRDYIAEYDRAAREILAETAPEGGSPPPGPDSAKAGQGGSPARAGSAGATIARAPAMGGTTARPPAKPGSDDPRDAPPPVTYGEGIDSGVRVGVLVVRDDDAWVPAFGSTTGVTAKIYELDPERPGVWLPSRSVTRQITVTFVRRSDEPGRNMNTSLDEGPRRSPDLLFDPRHQFGATCSDDPTGRGHHGTCRTDEEENAFGFRITSEDDGAFGAVDASCDGCVQLRPIGPKRFGANRAFPIGIEEADPDARAALVPRDDNGNRISDGYAQEKTHVTLATDDLDDAPAGNGTSGDGLSAYEEYRGFTDVSDRHVRTSWTRKDLFVENLEGLPLFTFLTASGLNVHEIGERQHETRVINFNYGFAHLVNQHALRLLSGTLPDDIVGESSGFGPPKKVARVTIDVNEFSGTTRGPGGLDGRLTTGTGRTDSFRPALPEVIAGGNTVITLSQVVAHELGHAVGMRHHGNSRTHEEWWLPPAPAGEATRQRGQRHTSERLCGYTLPAPVLFGQKHNQASGDLICLMRYPNHGVAFKQEDGSVQCRGRNPAADAFCERSEGTGWNRGNRVAGNAAHGNCKGQIIVNDRFGGA